MALLTTWGSANRITSSALDVTYSSEIISGDSVTFYGVTRTAYKTYKYIGMTKATAEDCRAALQTKYYRSFAAFELSGSKIVQKFSFGRTANIAVAPETGDNYSVNISVSESDYVITDKPCASLEECKRLFQFAEVRDYEEDGTAASGIAIATANFDPANMTVRVRYAQNITDFVADAVHLTLEYKGSGGAWTATSGATVDSATVTVQSAYRKIWRLRYHTSASAADDIISNEIEATEDEPSERMINVTSCVTDASLFEVDVNFTSPIVNAYTQISAEWYDEQNGAWVAISSSRVRERNVAQIRFKPPTRNLETYRLKYTNGDTVYYSQGFASTGDSAAGFAITAGAANISYTDALTATVNVTTNLVYARRMEEPRILAVITDNAGNVHVGCEPTSIVKTADNAYTVTFKNGQGLAAFDGLGTDTFKLYFGDLPQGAYYIESATFTPTVTAYSVSISNAVFATTDSKNVGKLTISTTMPEAARHLIRVKLRVNDSTTTYHEAVVAAAQGNTLFISKPATLLIDATCRVHCEIGTAASNEVVMTAGSLGVTLAASAAVVDGAANREAKVTITQSGIPAFDWNKLQLYVKRSDNNVYVGTATSPTSFDATTGVIRFKNFNFKEQAVGNKILLQYKINDDFVLEDDAFVASTYSLFLDRAAEFFCTAIRCAELFVAGGHTSASQVVVKHRASASASSYTTLDVIAIGDSSVLVKFAPMGGLLHIEENGLVSDEIEGCEGETSFALTLSDAETWQNPESANAHTATVKFSSFNVPGFDSSKLTLHQTGMQEFADIEGPESFTTATGTAVFRDNAIIRYVWPNIYEYQVEYKFDETTTLQSNKIERPVY